MCAWLIGALLMCGGLLGVKGGRHILCGATVQVETCDEKCGVRRVGTDGRGYGWDDFEILNGDRVVFGGQSG